MEKKELLKAIEQGLLASEMAVKFKMHDLNLYEKINKLENNGYTLHRTYYSDGQFKYEFGADNKKNITREIDIITKPDEKRISFVCMADLHLASNQERRIIVEKAYQHAKDNGIHSIFMAGDILDGKVGPSTTYEKTGEEQIQEFLGFYPFDNNIITYGVLGDHDESIYKYDYVDPRKVITQARHNIVLPSYFNNIFNIKNSSIVLAHKNSKLRIYPELGKEKYHLMIKGHPHGFKFESFSNYSVITLPAACKNAINGVTGFVEITLFYNNDCLHKIEGKQYAVFNSDEVLLGCFSSDINVSKVKHDNIEDYNHIIISNPYPYIKNMIDSTSLEDLKKDNEEKTDELEKLKEEVDKLKNENIELTSSLKESHSIEASLSNSIKIEKINKRKNKEKIEELEIENKRVFDSNKQLKTNNKMLKDDNNNLKEEKQELLKELNEAKRLIEELKNNPQIIEVPVVVEKVIEKVEPKPVVEEVVETPADEEITPVIDEVVETLAVEEAKEETVELDSQEVHELYNMILNDDYYKYFRKQRAIEFSEYLKDRKEKSKDRTEELVNIIAEELYKELTKEVPVKKEEKDKTLYYQEFKKERIEEFSKLNKKEEKKRILKSEKRLK